MDWQKQWVTSILIKNKELIILRASADILETLDSGGDCSCCGRQKWTEINVKFLKTRAKDWNNIVLWEICFLFAYCENKLLSQTFPFFFLTHICTLHFPKANLLSEFAVIAWTSNGRFSTTVLLKMSAKISNLPWKNVQGKLAIFLQYVNSKNNIICYSNF